jgi:hypothetical protein
MSVHEGLKARIEVAGVQEVLKRTAPASRGPGEMWEFEGKCLSSSLKSRKKSSFSEIDLSFKTVVLSKTQTGRSETVD